MNEIDRWIEYMKKNPEWKEEHTRFINAQFKKQQEFLRRLKEQPGGKEKIIKMYGIKNIKGYERLLG